MIRTYRTALFLAFMLMTINALAAKGDTEAAAEGWQRVADGAVLVDVRSPEEFSEGHAYGALNLPMGDEDAWGAYLANHPEQGLIATVTLKKAKEAL